MTSFRKSNEQQSKSYEKLGRLYYLICWKSCDNEAAINKVLDLEGDINYQFPNDSHKNITAGSTALHFAIKDYDGTKVAARLLINRGADPTIKNQQDMTPIHIFIRNFYNHHYHSLNRDTFMSQDRLDERSDYPIIDSLLSAQVRLNKSVNPRDPYGISHFHAACMANHVEAVEFFLRNQVDINEAVNNDSPIFTGYTALHFATRFGCVEVANVLLSHNADLFSKDSKGRTPVHLAVLRNMMIIQYKNMLHQHYEISFKWPQYEFTEEQLISKIENGQNIITNILLKIDKTLAERLGLSVLYTMHQLKKDVSLENFAKININQQVAMDSAFWPGYNALHFAARFDDVNTFKLLLEKDVDVEAKDANGETPLDMCVGTFDVEDIHNIVSSYSKWRDIMLTDGKTKLVDLLYAMPSPVELASFIDDLKLDINDFSIPTDSPLWPGFTILHLAVMLSKKCMCVLFRWYRLCHNNELVKVCIDHGADVTTLDVHGSSPLHLAFRRLDMCHIFLLLEHHESNANPIDKDNLSHLHIACVMKNEVLVKKLIDARANVNVAVLTSFQWDWKVKCAHRMSLNNYFIIGAGSTPLHVAMTDDNDAIRKLLIEAGADIHVKDVNGLTPIHISFSQWMGNIPISLDEIFSSTPPKDVVVNGLSYLHITMLSYSCEYPKSVEVMKKMLDLGADINSVIVPWDNVYTNNREITKDGENEDFYFEIYKRPTLLAYFFKHFEGDTPLQLSFRTHIDLSKEDSWAGRFLMDQGADVLVKNVTGRRPIYDIMSRPKLLEYYMLNVMKDEDEKRLSNEIGVTKLHLACILRDEKMIENCLKKGANVNAQIQNDSKLWPGFTPLHMLVEFYWKLNLCKYNIYNHHFCFSFRKKICNKTKKDNEKVCNIIRLLIKHGADVTIADINGDTPLLLKFWQNLANVRVQPPHIKVLMNSLKKTNVNPVNNEGISHFHIACMLNDIGLMKKFLKLGVDVNQTVDYFSSPYGGYTPLHFAVYDRRFSMRNDFPPLKAVNLLLKHGANVYALNVNDQTPLLVAAKLICTFNLAYKRILRAGVYHDREDIINKVSPERAFEETRKNVIEVYKSIHVLCYYYLIIQFARG